MKPLAIVGLIVLVLGVASLFVGLPRTESHGIKMGDASIGVQTKTSERLPLIASIAMIIGGGVVTAAGMKKS
jgi:hypothetical protein